MRGSFMTNFIMNGNTWYLPYYILDPPEPEPAFSSRNPRVSSRSPDPEQKLQV